MVALSAVNNPSDAMIAKAIEYVTAQIGKPYSETLDGGVGPDYFDCSGLCMMGYAAAGVKIPRTTWAQLAGIKTKVAGLSHLLPGDLIYAAPYPGDQHVVFYVGGGMIIQAPHTGATVFKSTLAAGFPYTPIGIRRPVPGGSAGIVDLKESPPAKTATEDSFFSSVSGASTVVGDVTSGSWWERVGIGAAGLALIGFGVLELTHTKGAVTSAAVSTVKGLAS